MIACSRPFPLPKRKARALSFLAIVPKDAAAKKPPYGSPCSRCGVCCMASRCPLGQHVFGIEEPGPCPALTSLGEAGYGCGLVLDPRRFSPVRAATHGVETLRRAAFLLIDVGGGCDARINGEPRNEALAAEWDAKAAREAIALRHARQLWGQR